MRWPPRWPARQRLRQLAFPVPVPAIPLLTAGPERLSCYGIGQPVPGLSRVTAGGGATVDSCLRVTVHQGGGPALTWERVPISC